MQKQKRAKVSGYETAERRRAEAIRAAIAEEKFTPEDALGLTETATWRREQVEAAERIVTLVCRGQRLPAEFSGRYA